MSDPVPGKKRATYQDVLDAPPEKVAEIIAGELYLWPRPFSPHAAVTSALGEELGPPFKRGRGGPDAPSGKVAEIINGDLHLWPRPHSPHSAVQTALVRGLGPFDPGDGGPGGWTILFEPELHLGSDVLVPDIASWRSHRLPVVTDGHIASAPDWVCEILSPSTERIDRMEKMPVYAATGVCDAWLVSPRERAVEAYRLVDGRWLTVGVFTDIERSRIEPFDAIELGLAALWAKIPLPSRAQDEAAQYG